MFWPLTYLCLSDVWAPMNPRLTFLRLRKDMFPNWHLPMLFILFWFNSSRSWTFINLCLSDVRRLTLSLGDGSTASRFTSRVFSPAWLGFTTISHFLSLIKLPKIHQMNQSRNCLIVLLDCLAQCPLPVCLHTDEAQWPSIWPLISFSLTLYCFLLWSSLSMNL